MWTNFLKQHNLAQAAARERPLKPSPSPSAAQIDTTQDLNVEADIDGAAQQEALDRREKQTLPHRITVKEIDKLAQLNMNGRYDHLSFVSPCQYTLDLTNQIIAWYRQIKNILKTAQLLATKREEGLSYEHVETVMDVTQHLHSTNLESERTRASLFS